MVISFISRFDLFLDMTNQFILCISLLNFSDSSFQPIMYGDYVFISYRLFQKSYFFLELLMFLFKCIDFSSFSLNIIKNNLVYFLIFDSLDKLLYSQVFKVAFDFISKFQNFLGPIPSSKWGKVTFEYKLNLQFRSSLGLYGTPCPYPGFYWWYAWVQT